MKSDISTKMFVPKTITVGYQKRDDTYTKKLAYVIYTDDKGVLRKEKSWQSWRDKKIDQDVFDNVPTAGFVLNKKVGGYKYDWNVRRTMVRVYDPRNFEFEITIENLLFILQETSAIQGKGLEGEFVYSWSGSELVLLPTCAAEYQECVNYTKLQTTKVGKADMVEGATYLMKDMTEVLYLGKHHFCEKVRWYEDKSPYKPVGPRHIFKPLKKRENKWDPDYIAQTGFSKIASKTGDASPDFADAYDEFKNSRYCDKVIDVQLKRVKPTKDDYYGTCYVLKEGDKHFYANVYQQRSNWNYRLARYDEPTFEYVKGDEIDLTVKNGTVTLPKGYARGSRRGLGDSHELYSAVLVTEKGHRYSITKER